MTGNEVTIAEIYDGDRLEAVRALFVEYAEWLGFPLDFQGFDQELASLPGPYAPPSGRLFVAWSDDRAVGCVGVRALKDRVCEMKRLYVRAEARGAGLGQALAEAALHAARSIGYEEIRLDTIASRMPRAIRLYRALGFVETGAYRFNPFPDAVYMSLGLKPSRGRMTEEG